jgi:drug/metabolite transporter (DMT)-like permease
MKFRAIETPRRLWAGLPPTVRGALWMLLACAFFAVMGATIRHLSRTLPTFELIFFRNAIAFLCMMPWVLHVGFAALRTSNFKLYAGRSVIAFLSMALWFTALAAMPLAEAVALSFTAPMFGTVLAVLFLGEIVRLRRWSATIIGFLGAMVILRPGVADVTYAHVIVMASALTSAINSIVVKKLTRTENPNTIVTYMTMLTTPFALLLALPGWIWPSLDAWIWILVLGAAGTIGHLASTRAFKHIDASLVMTFDFARLPFSALVAWFAFAESPDRWTWIGGAIIAASSVYITRREAKLARQGALAEPSHPVLAAETGTKLHPGVGRKADG